MPDAFSGGNDITALSDRMTLLSAVRAVLVVLVIVASFTDVVEIPNRWVLVAPILAMVIVASIVEFARRQLSTPTTWLVPLAIAADAVYVTGILLICGGPGTPLTFLAYFHLVAVTLLASYRTGAKLAVWYSGLFLLSYILQRGGFFDGSKFVAMATRPELAHRAALAGVALWVIALGTTWFSSLNERELRRRRTELSVTSTATAPLVRLKDPMEIMATLVRTVETEFDFTAAVVLFPMNNRFDEWAVVENASHHFVAIPRDRVFEGVFEKAWTERTTTIHDDADSIPQLIATALPSARFVMLMPLVAEDESKAMLAVEWLGQRSITKPVIELLEQIASNVALAMNNAMLMQEVERLAATDGLTGLANRRVFDSTLDREIARCDRVAAPLSLVLLDLDHFKDVNDTFGHQTGDEVLKTASTALLSECRAEDMAVRFGGEEMAVILPGCTASEALAAAERLRSAMTHNLGSRVITASAGVATYPDHALDATTLVAAADEALYRSKENGRNRSTQAG